MALSHIYKSPDHQWERHVFLISEVCEKSWFKIFYIGLARWYTPIIQVLREAGVKEQWSEAGLGKSLRSYLKNKLKQKYRGHGSSPVLSSVTGTEDYLQ
jgi:hypothetical protein